MRREDEGHLFHRTAVCHQAYPDTSIAACMGCSTMSKTPSSLGGPKIPSRTLGAGLLSLLVSRVLSSYLESELRIDCYTRLLSSRTQPKHTFPVRIGRPDLSKLKPESKKYRNPVIYAQELHDEMVRDNLTRKQLAERYGISSVLDRRVDII